MIVFARGSITNPPALAPCMDDEMRVVDELKSQGIVKAVYRRAAGPGVLLILEGPRRASRSRPCASAYQRRRFEPCQTTPTGRAPDRAGFHRTRTPPTPRPHLGAADRSTRRRMGTMGARTHQRRAARGSPVTTRRRPHPATTIVSSPPAMPRARWHQPAARAPHHHPQERPSGPPPATPITGAATALLRRDDAARR